MPLGRCRVGFEIGRLDAKNNSMECVERNGAAAAEQAVEQALEDAACERRSRIDIEEQWKELWAELLVAKGREEGLQYALQRAYGCKCMKL